MQLILALEWKDASRDYLDVFSATFDHPSYLELESNAQVGWVHRSVSKHCCATVRACWHCAESHRSLAVCNRMMPYLLHWRQMVGTWCVFSVLYHAPVDTAVLYKLWHCRHSSTKRALPYYASCSYGSALGY